MPVAPASLPAVAVPARYRSSWRLFTDWATATGRQALPADPITVALFLDEMPAAAATLRSRATAINRVHTRCGHPAPGTAAAIRAHLTRRTHPVTDTRSQAETAIAALPTTGWTAGLFGRRDALLLVLSAYAQLPHAAIARLARRDITLTDSGSLHISGVHDITVAGGTNHPATGAVPVYLRWAHLQAHMDRYPSPTATARALRAAAPVTKGTRSNPHTPTIADPLAPLLPRFDQWGSAPFTRAGLSRQAIATLVARHLCGTATPHCNPAGTRISRPEFPTPEPEPAPDDTPTPPPLEWRYDTAVAAKRTAVRELSTLTGTFDDIDDRITTLLDRTAALLDEYRL